MVKEGMVRWKVVACLVEVQIIVTDDRARVRKKPDLAKNLDLSLEQLIATRVKDIAQSRRQAKRKLCQA